MPSTIFISHSSNLSQTQCHCSKLKRPSFSYTKISSSLNPKPPNNVSKESSESKPPWEPIKMPTPPWVRTPLIVQPHEIIELSKNPRKTTRYKSSNELSERLVNRRGKKDTTRIARSIEKLGEKFDSFGETRKSSGNEFSDRLLNLGENDGAARIVRSVEKLGEKVDSFGEISKNLGNEFSDRLLNPGENDGAARIVRSVEKLGEKVDSFGEISKNLGNEFSDRLLNLGENDGAARIVRIVEKICEKVDFSGKTRKNSGNEFSDRLLDFGENDGNARIVRRIEKHGEKFHSGETRKESIRELSDRLNNFSEKCTTKIAKRLEGITGVGDCFDPLQRLGKTRSSRVAEKMPWEIKEGFVVRRMKKERVASVAELTLEKELLERLRDEARKMNKWVKVKKAGVTEDVVSYVKSIWKSDELVMVRFDVPLCRNMDRAQEILEMKTGGLVVWSRKDTLVIYRGSDYRPCKRSFSRFSSPNLAQVEKGNRALKYDSFENSKYGTTTSYKNAEAEPVHRRTSIFGNGDEFRLDRSLYEREADRILEGLGPRFVDWWMNKPLPVDADLLPEVVYGFSPPVRRCVPCARSKINDYELTYLRKLAIPLPTHFVLGRNRKLQGLAVAILKLWEKCHIAKIAVKMGALNTSNKEMANELKSLTGGVLLLRNKYIIVLYRGKDFIPPGVSELISERETELEYCQQYEENVRLEVAETLFVADEPQEGIGSAGTLSEFQGIQIEYVDPNKEDSEIKLPFEAEKAKLEKELKNLERKLSILNNKIERSTDKLLKLNGEWNSSERSADQEMITREERECLRNIGLKMRGVLVLGRRGVFDGVIEGVRQHWKHREVVRVVTMQRLYWRVVCTARTLEAETGGLLISIEKLKRGHAIIIYRGKNYRRPILIKSGNLLTKRKALLRSLEMQRNGSLKFFAYQRQRAISELKQKLENLQGMLEVDQRKNDSYE